MQLRTQIQSCLTSYCVSCICKNPFSSLQTTNKTNYIKFSQRPFEVSIVKSVPKSNKDCTVIFYRYSNCNNIRHIAKKNCLCRKCVLNRIKVNCIILFGPFYPLVMRNDNYVSLHSLLPLY